MVAGIAYNGRSFEGIYLARLDDMIYAGKVEHGFTPEQQKELEEAGEGARKPDSAAGQENPQTEGSLAQTRASGRG